MTNIENVPLILIGSSKEDVASISSSLKKYTDLNISNVSTELNDLKIVLSEKKPCVVMLGPDFEMKDIEKIVKDFEYNLRFVMIILLSRTISAGLLKNAIKLGMADVIQYPLDFSELDPTIEKINKIMKQLLQNMEEEAAIFGKKPDNRAKTIMIFGTKGGSGKSFLASNLAINIHQATKKSVLLFDLHYDYGDASLILNIFPKQTIFDLSMVLDQINPDFLNDFLVGHTSGIKILPAPLDPAQAESIDLSTTVKIFDVLSRSFDYIVIDCPPRFSEEVLALLKKVDSMCVIASMDVSSIKNMKISLKLLEQLKFPSDKITTIINRSNTKVGIEVADIEETIFRKIDVLIPSSIMVPLSINKGKPIILSYPKSPISASINKLTGLIMAKLS